MFSRRNQHTIARPCRVSGFGYWSGRDITVEFHPADPDTGIVFVRTDLSGRPRIPASVAYRVAMPRRTNLTCGDASVEMVEHVMAALRGLEIDNCEVHADAAEMPGLDGSALPLVVALDEAGLAEQAERRRRCVVDEPLRCGTDTSWIESRPCCSGRTILQYALDYGTTCPIGKQQLELVLTPESFRRELAPCRTFMLESEAVALQQKGLGGRVTYQDVLVFGPQGPIDNTLRFPNECVRHKLLDLVGDLGLAGCDLVGRFSAYRSGHHLNTELVETLLAKQPQELKRCA